MKYVLYHKNCPDGFGAAFAAWLSLGDEDVKYIPVTYGEEPPKEIYGDNHVFIVDFSYKRAVLEDIHSRVTSLTVLDHHKTAQKDLEGLPYCTFDMNRSGALITYDYFHGSGYARQREFFQYISDRDLWQFKMLSSKEFNIFLMSLEYTFANYQDALAKFCDYDEYDHHNGFIDQVAEGEAILRKDKKDIEMICAQARLINWIPAGLTNEINGSIKTVIVNATSHFSDVGNRLLELFPDAKMSVSFYLGKDGKWRHSLRSRGEDGVEKGGFDTTIVAQMYGGGGHRNASGFTWHDYPRDMYEQVTA